MNGRLDYVLGSLWEELSAERFRRCRHIQAKAVELRDSGLGHLGSQTHGKSSLQHGPFGLLGGIVVTCHSTTYRLWERRQYSSNSLQLDSIAGASGWRYSRYGELEKPRV